MSSEGVRFSADELLERQCRFIVDASRLRRTSPATYGATDLFDLARALELKDRRRIPARLRRELLGSPCAYCGGEAEEVDHIYPVSDGGSSCRENLAPACWFCNREKANQPVGVWRARRLRAAASWPPSASPLARMRELQEWYEAR